MAVPGITPEKRWRPANAAASIRFLMPIARVSVSLALTFIGLTAITFLMDYEHMDFVEAIEELAQEAGAQPWDGEAPQADESLAEKVEAAAKNGLLEAYGIADKMQRRDAIDTVKKALIESLCDEDDEAAPEAAATEGDAEVTVEAPASDEELIVPEPAEEANPPVGVVPPGE